mgnify:CR=1 FL=1
MADVAAIFHWPPAAFDTLSVQDIMMWRELAIERAKLLHGSGKQE